MRRLGKLLGLCVGVVLASTLGPLAQAQSAIIPDQIGGPSLSVWMAPATMTVGQTAQVTWVSDYGTIVHIECVANPGGFVFPGADGPPTGSPTIGPATEAWVTNPSTCTFTATLEGDPGITIKQLVINTNPAPTPPALALLACTTNSPSTAPTPATTSCSVKNTGGTALSSIAYSSIAGLTISGPTGACAANSTCGTLLVSTGTTPGGPYSGTLTATPNTGSAAQVAISLTVNPGSAPALTLSGCTSVTPTTTPTPASTTCTVKNTGGTAVSSISYASSSVAGASISGPTGACAGGGTTCGSVTLTTGTAAGLYAGNLVATPNTGSSASVAISLTVNPIGGVTEVVSYVHTDGLGSPVAKTNASGARISLSKYEAYGMTLAGSDTPTIGFTGHFNDADTGLTYMQQRYYDPVGARFMSEDPVMTDAQTGSSFNRYVYGNNNPYRFVDPDGRAPCQGRNGAGPYSCEDIAGGNDNEKASAWVAGLNDSKARFSDALGGSPCEGSECTQNLATALGFVVKPIALANGAYASYNTGSAIPLLAAVIGAKYGSGRAAIPELRISAGKYPQLAENISNAQKAGHPSLLTHGGNAPANRVAALNGVPSIKGMSRDEYPFASSMQGGQGAWVGHIPQSQQSAQGGLIKNFVQQHGIKAGDQYRVVIVP